MRAEGLSLRDFRLCRETECRFSPEVNVITGANAQGKTTILEALWMLTCGRSFRTRSDRETVSFGRPSARLSAELFFGGREQGYELLIPAAGRRSIKVNGVSKTPQALSGGFRAVLFEPEDLELVRGGAAERRRFMDSAICQLRPAYAAALTEANRLLEHITRILRDCGEQPSLLDMLDDFSLRYAAVCARLVFYRSAWCERLAGQAEKIHADISGGETLSMSYTPGGGAPTGPGVRQRDIYDALAEHFYAHREAEIKSRQCLSGAHKDDIELTLDGAPARAFASQGQARTAALAMKLAERDVCAADSGEAPVLLLDDVLSELDPRRQDFVLNRITGGQALITCCADDGISRRTGGRVLTVEGGKIT